MNPAKKLLWLEGEIACQQRRIDMCLAKCDCEYQKTRRVHQGGTDLTLEELMAKAYQTVSNQITRLNNMYEERNKVMDDVMSFDFSNIEYHIAENNTGVTYHAEFTPEQWGKLQQILS
jgi:hypothetical protein